MEQTSQLIKTGTNLLQSELYIRGYIWVVAEELYRLDTVSRGVSSGED